jgi:hypothetical protein
MYGDFLFCINVFMIAYVLLNMPETKQIVFVEKVSTPSQDKIVSTLVELGYVPLVDSVHGLHHGWYLSNIAPCPHKLYTVDLLGKRLIEYEVADLPTNMTSYPDMVIYFNQGDQVTDVDWYHIRHWLRFHLLEEEVDAALVEKGSALILKPVKQIVALPSEEKKEEKDEDEENKCYTFTSQYLEEDDIMLYQICKPFTDLPYTSVLRDYSKKGPTRFFSSLFVCPSWGVSRFDVPFLEYIWKHRLNMDGVFDMDQLLREATEACYPRDDGVVPETEPEVYRRALSDVVVTLESRKKGISCGASHAVPAHYDQVQSHDYATSNDLPVVDHEDVDMFLDKEL